MKKVGVLTIHGIGTDESFTWSQKRLVRNIRKKLGKDVELVEEHIVYGREIQDNQEKYQEKADYGFRLIKDFIHGWAGDAMSIANNPKVNDIVMNTIRDAIYRMETKLGEGEPFIILAHSLGAYLISNFIWDNHTKRENEDMAVLLEERCKYIASYGANIPIFVGSKPPEEIKAFKKLNEDFEWHNFWSKSDILGFPLRPMSPSYDRLVRDVRVIGWIPILSHIMYRFNCKVTKEIAKKISSIAK